MVWLICMIISGGILGILLIMFVASFFFHSKISNLNKWFFTGIFLASVVMFVPCYIDVFSGLPWSGVKTALACIHHTIRLFVVDGELTFVSDCVFRSAPAYLASPYIALGSVLFLLAPLVTFSFILSFFKSAFAFNHYILGYRKEKFLFSEVNEKSLNLAENLRKSHPGALIVFADTDEKVMETEFDYYDRLLKINAICFKNDINTINLRFGSSGANITLFLLADDESVNMKQALITCKRYQTMKNVSVYVQASSSDSELILSKSITPPEHSTLDSGSGIKVRRVNDVHLLVNHILYTKGSRIFDTAAPAGKDGDKRIAILLVGMGIRGTEMLRALPAFCQMDGYRVEITAVDADEKAQSRFSALCPELVDHRHNGDFTTPGEAHYRIDFVSGMEIGTAEFVALLEKLSPLTYVFISLGDDSQNISAAKSIRVCCERLGRHPMIHTIVNDSEKAEILHSSEGESIYDIDFIGDIRSFYTEEVIVASELENAALARHKKWGSEVSFWSSEYNYRSSIASVIHYKMKQHCGIPQIELPPDQRTDPERENIRILEHRRWNAYMRSEGYVYGERKDHLLKTHYNLLPFYELSPEAQAKDDE